MKYKENVDRSYTFELDDVRMRLGVKGKLTNIRTLKSDYNDKDSKEMVYVDTVEEIEHE